MVRLFTDDRATRSGGKTKPNFGCALLSSASVLALGPPARCHCPSSVSLPRKLTIAGPDQRRLSENVYGMVLDEAGAMLGFWLIPSIAGSQPPRQPSCHSQLSQRLPPD